MRTIDITPTWTETARMLVFIMENANETGREHARKEIIRMGEIIDAYRAAEKEGCDAG
jgi:hypothetical protein